jgi:hypothetical protein
MGPRTLNADQRNFCWPQRRLHSELTNTGMAARRQRAVVSSFAPVKMSSESRRGYSRGQYWGERVRMMAWGANHLDQLKSVGVVVPIKRQQLHRWTPAVGP